MKVGGKGDNRGGDGFDGITDAMDMSLSRLQELVMDSYSHDEITSQCFSRTSIQCFLYIYLLLWQPFNEGKQVWSGLVVGCCNNSFHLQLLQSHVCGLLQWT